MPVAPQPTAETRIADILADPRCREMRRDFRVDRASIDVEARTVPLSFASEAPVDRWFGREILDISEDACDLDRLRNGGAILVNHDWNDQVGVVIEATVDRATKKARCIAKFSRSARGEEIFQDIRDGIRSLVSVGYIVRKMVLQSMEDEVETHRVTDWQPYEVSVVAVPADTSVGVGRSAASNTRPPERPVTQPSSPSPQLSSRMSATTTEPATPPAVTTPPIAETRSAPIATSGVDLSAERQRIKDINGAAAVLIANHPAKADVIRQLASKCAETGDGIAVFHRTVNEDILATTRSLAPVTQDPNAGRVGLSAKDAKRYSLMRAIQRSMNNQPLDGLEGECNAELTRKLDRQPKGFFLPEEILADRRNLQLGGNHRTLTAGVPADGGYTVGVQDLVGEFVTYLRNNAVVMKAGARTITGLVGDITIPRQLTGATAYWVSETGSITQSGATYGQIVGRPRRIGTSVPYSKQFLAQSSLSVESEVVNDSDASIALDLDRVALRGVGGAEPLGIANLVSGDRSTGVTFSTSPTWAKYLEFFSSVAGNNSITGTPAYVASVASAVKAMATAKFSNTATPIWDQDRVGVFPAYWTTQLLTSATPVANMVIFGDFSQVLFLEWAGRDVVVDPYVGKKEGTVEVTIQRLMDVVIKRGKSFSCSTDSGAQ